MTIDMLPFGKKIKVRNFVVLKYSKSMNAADVRRLRSESGIPAEMQKYLQRGSLPYIKVSTVSANWSVEFACGMGMYKAIDGIPLVGDGSSVMLSDEVVSALNSLFSMMFADCTVFGDAEYFAAKGDALKSFVGRQKAADVSLEEDAATLKELKILEDTKSAIAEMSSSVAEEGGV